MFAPSGDRDGGGVRIAAGEYRHVDLTVREDILWNGLGEYSFRFDLVSGSPIEVFVMTPDHFEAYKAGEPLAEYENYILVDGYETGSPYLPPGRYVVVLDNTEFGAVTPSEDSVVRFRVG
jgi:hypothetical protein